MKLLESEVDDKERIMFDLFVRPGPELALFLGSPLKHNPRDWVYFILFYGISSYMSRQRTLTPLTILSLTVHPNPP